VPGKPGVDVGVSGQRLSKRSNILDSKAIFITGAASGIGRATARLFYNEGWFVGCYDVDEMELTALKAELGDNCCIGLLDVTDKPLFDQTMADFAELTQGRLDLMFNNAGIAVGGYFDEVPFEELLKVVDVNFIGVLNGIHAAIPYLKNTDNSLCFTTSSSAATFGSPTLAVYAATKHAVKGLTEALSVELSRYGVRAADVLPGIIDTAIWKDSPSYENGVFVSSSEKLIEGAADRTDRMRLIGAEEVASCVWEAYGSDKLHWYVPPEIVDLDLAKAKSPEAVRDRMINPGSEQD
jgi:NAD(P)-dependent dehydrogenase (short-subunit alcohol dehydrogenase family)